MITATGTRTAFLPFARPMIEVEDVDEVADVLRSEWLTAGPRTQKLELAVAEATGAPAALALSSGTAGMHAALVALGVRPGAAVITTPMTFCATAHVIEHIGARPVFVDVEPDTLNLDPERVAQVLADGRHDVGAILPVHYGGHPVELDRLLALARDAGVPVVEDAAHAFGATYRGVPIGQVEPDDGDRAVSFSLYATKNVTSGEGGVLTGAEPLVRACRPWILHGITRDSWERYGPRGAWEYDVLEPGFKYNLSDLAAALGESQVRRWRSFQQRRTEIAARYSAQLAALDEIDTPVARPHVVPAWHLYPIRLRLDALTIDRGEFIEQLRRRNIGTSVHFIPVPALSYYRHRYGFDRDALPVTAAESERLISLPIYPRMTDEDVDDVVAAIRDTLAGHRR
ncbi:DegT/DnrJ/EryC1/StrS family aminotransferase [Actinomycetospora sp. CA-101289]|uniref:DegT/DnrJ/EryC1/StrS family aminotransferase n=1 Tax=Actinomycetospora sp. CA-101289 TaxID=3239893 RepID=UPI003D967ECA